jgi:type 1 glutamine amidotransferase
VGTRAAAAYNLPKAGGSAQRVGAAARASSEENIMPVSTFLRRGALLSLALGLVLLLVATLGVATKAADIDPYDQSGVPLEKQPPKDAKVSKIVLVAGHKSHGKGEHEFFAGCALLMNLLKQTSGVFPVMARDGWPKNPETFEDAKAIVFYMDGGDRHPIIQRDHREVVQKMMDAGVGFVNLHYAVEYPKSQSDHVLQWLGGYYETNYSWNPHWVAEIKSLPEHPITRGVKPFSINDEWYFNMRFKPESKGVTSILVGTPPDKARGGNRVPKVVKENKGRDEILAWAFNRANGGRSFGFTGAHFHRNWGDENFRRLVVNAILWTAKLDVPRDGAKVEMSADDLNRNLDRK